MHGSVFAGEIRLSATKSSNVRKIEGDLMDKNYLSFRKLQEWADQLNFADPSMHQTVSTRQTQSQRLMGTISTIKHVKALLSQRNPAICTVQAYIRQKSHPELPVAVMNMEALFQTLGFTAKHQISEFLETYSKIQRLQMRLLSEDGHYLDAVVESDVESGPIFLIRSIISALDKETSFSSYQT